MTRVDVAVPGHPYPVLIGAGALDRLGETLGGRRAVLIADRRVQGTALELSKVHRMPMLSIRGGERAKTLGGLRTVIDFLESSGVERGGCVVVLGGGTLGDLAGFAAAVWLRGVAHVQIPTTLVAMVDSSLGGKTAINTAKGKNVVGAFWQPSAVVADLRLLRSLPRRQFRAGFGEVVKYALAVDPGLVAHLDSGRAQLMARDEATLEPVVARCVEAKAAVVADDERDLGRRAILNYGHTAGHALEVASGYRLLHGEAVALGMRVSARVSLAMGLCDLNTVAEQDRLLASFGLPNRLAAIDLEAVMQSLPRDKKSSDGEPRWVLLRAVGRAEPGHRVPPQTVRKALGEVLVS